MRARQLYLCCPRRHDAVMVVVLLLLGSGGAAAALVVLGIVVDSLDVPDKICPPFGFQLTEFAFVDFGQVDFPDVITKISEQREK